MTFIMKSWKLQLKHLLYSKKVCVFVSKSADEARTVASKMINCRIFTKQTGTAGSMCHKVMICERLYSRREYYFAIVMDRAKAVSLIVVNLFSLTACYVTLPSVL